MLQAEATAITHEAFHSGSALAPRHPRAGDECDTNVGIYLSNVGTQASLIAGFVFVLFTEEVPVRVDTVHPTSSVVVMMAATACFGAMIYTVVCLLDHVEQPRSDDGALKGAETSSMRRAVEHMKIDRHYIVRVFGFDHWSRVP